MAYNPYKDVNAIYNLKNEWASANNAGDNKKKNEVAAEAVAYYNNLRNGGYSDLADKLQKEDNNLARITKDYYAKTGRTATRPYLYDLGKSKGLSTDDMDKIIGYDETTGEVSIGGKKIGKPDAVTSDGTSYWSDTSVLDNAFNDYVNRIGMTTPTGVNNMAYNQNAADIKSKTNELWGIQTTDRSDIKSAYGKLNDYTYNHNPYDSKIGKSIMADYEWKGDNAAYNESASGAASNGGNVDSFAAANAARQQLAFTNAGKQAVLADHNARIANIHSQLESLGLYQQNQDVGMQNTLNIMRDENQRLFNNSESQAQRLFDNEQTNKMNDHTINMDIANVTGYVPAAWSGEGNPYLNRDGSLKEEYKNTDFSDLIAAARKNGNAELVRTLQEARGAKGMTYSDEYGKYLVDGNWDIPGRRKTYAWLKDDADRESAEKLAAGELEYNKYVTDAETGLAKAQIDAQVQMNTDNNTVTKYVTDANNQAAIDQMTTAADLGLGESSNGTKLESKVIDEWVTHLNTAAQNEMGSDVFEKTGPHDYKVINAGEEFVASRILESTSLTDTEKKYLLLTVFNIDPDVINTIATDAHYSKN